MKRVVFLLSGMLFILGVLWVGRLPAVYAQDESSISQGFQTDETITDGTLVSIERDQPDRVSTATASSAQRLIGVAATDTLVALGEEATKTQIVISGTALALVSDINGAIQSGDKVTISPIEGVGMKATSSGQIVGTAQADFSEVSKESRTVKDREGKSHTVRIGRVPVQIGIAYYTAPASQFLPPFIQNIADSIAGKPVPLIRVLLAGSLLIVSAVSIFILIYASTRSGIISLGRNPLAAGAINKELLQVGIYAVLILAFALLASYLILSL